MADPLEVWPFNDIHKHVSGLDCWCQPVQRELDEAIVHNAADRREDYVERGRKMH
jgi:hypothetical protein